MPERADVFAKAGWYLALLKPPDLGIDLSLGWQAADRKANGETDFIGKTAQSNSEARGTAEAEEESIACRDVGGCIRQKAWN